MDSNKVKPKWAASPLGVENQAKPKAYIPFYRRPILCSAITIGILCLIALLFVILAVTVFKTKNARITVNSVKLDDIHVSLDWLRLRVNLNVTLNMDLSVKNPNKASFKFTNSTTLLYYRGATVGQALIPAGKITRGIQWKVDRLSMASFAALKADVFGKEERRQVIPYRQPQPEAYRLYLELLTRYGFSFPLTNVVAHREKTVKAVDDGLRLSQCFGMPVTELGQTLVLFVFTVVSNLVDATAEDLGLQVGWSEKQLKLTGCGGQHDMEIEVKEDINDIRCEHRQHLRRTNTVMAIEVIGKLMEHERTSTLLRLARRNVPEQWRGLLHWLQILEAHSSSSNSKINGELYTKLTVCIQKGFSQEYQPNQHGAIRALIDAGSRTSTFGHNYGVELIKSLQALNGASWQETFLCLWTAALRLVQRERDPIEGPVPHLDVRLCILLSITPLSIAYVIEEEERVLKHAENNTLGNLANTNGYEIERKASGTRSAALASSLQILGQFDALLVPPQSVVSSANEAAAKAASFVSTFNSGGRSFDGLSSNGNSSKAVGNMRHLIVEACIARRLIDSSAYFWSGYVGGLVNPLSHSTPVQGSPWSAFMEGAPLSVSLRNALIATPASSLAELEKIYQIAISGPEEETSAAASILCGTSLIRGWNVQEHTVRLVVRLLSPPPPADYRGAGSHLVAYAPLLYAILVGVTSVDTVHVLSLHGMRRAQIVGTHMDFLASAIHGKISLGCEHATWKAYALGFLALVAACTPDWISDVDIETLKRVATGLRWWHETELAIALLERGGPKAMSAAAELAIMDHWPATLF